MIITKKDLKSYLSDTKKVYHKSTPKTLKEMINRYVFPDSNYKYMYTLRKYEYHYNNRGGIHTFLIWYYARKLAKWRYRTGIELMANVAGRGLHIPHGKVVINARTKIGDNCKIYSDVTIGIHGRYDMDGAPEIGNRVFIGSGARIIGNIRIADDIVIGANTVVVHDILEPGITVGGIPARKICNKGSYEYLNREK